MGCCGFFGGVDYICRRVYVGVVIMSAERPTSVRLPEVLEARLRELASRERRSISAQIVVLLEGALAGREPGGEDHRVSGSVSGDSRPASVSSDDTQEEAPASLPKRDLGAGTPSGSVAAGGALGKRSFRPDPKGGRKR